MNRRALRIFTVLMLCTLIVGCATPPVQPQIVVIVAETQATSTPVDESQKNRAHETTPPQEPETSVVTVISTSDGAVESVYTTPKNVSENLDWSNVGETFTAKGFEVHFNPWGQGASYGTLQLIYNGDGKTWGDFDNVPTAETDNEIWYFRGVFESAVSGHLERAIIRK